MHRLVHPLLLLFLAAALSGGTVPASAAPPPDCPLARTGRSLVTYPVGVDAVAALTAAGAQRVERIGSGRAVGVLRHGRPPGVLRVEPELVRRFHSTSADPFAAQQWALDVQHADQAARHGDGSGMVIAVLDSGVDAGHADLAGRVLPGYDAVADRPLVAGENSDVVGHGTAATGLIASVRGNGEGTAGLAPGASILPVVVGGDEGVTTTAFLRGLRWALDHGARVINLSFGGCGFSAEEQAEVNAAVARGAILVASVGNKDPSAADPTVYPAAYSGVVAVGATTREDIRADYSVRGAFVDLAAPGGSGNGTPGSDLITTLPRFPVTCPQGCYGAVAGTSFAAPYASAVMALVWSSAPALAPAEVVRVVTSTSADLGAPGQDAEYGAGRVDANGAVAMARALRQAGRVEGSDRYATAAALSAGAFSNAGAVYVARADGFSPDALTGGPAAIVRGGPLLLTERCRLPGATSQELARLQATEVVVLGGDAAVCDAIVERLAVAAGGARRLAGPDRYATAVAVALDTFPSGASTVYLARGDTFSPDALVAGPLAGLGNAPILLTPQCALSPTTSQALDRLATRTVVVLGGPGAVCEDVTSELAARGLTVSRLAGVDRYATAAAVARAMAPSDAEGVVVARGDTFSPDALAAAPYSARKRWPLLLTAQCYAPAATTNEINRLDVVSVALAGGSSAICDAQIARFL
jgi:minor extracellular protease Epr